MLITYDRAADALYIYFEEMRPRHVEKTLHDQPLRFDIDSAGQFTSIVLPDSEELQIESRLKHVSDNEAVRFEAEGNELVISFTDGGASDVLQWSGNVDLDLDDQMVGIEVLFGPRVRANDRLIHLRKFLTKVDPF